MNSNTLKEFLEEKASHYNQVKFIDSDPIQVPHLFTKKQDIEIAAFLTATIAWGQRNTIIKNAIQLMKLMDSSPYEFICQFPSKELKRFDNFRHRTFNASDCKFFMQSLQNIYNHHNGLEKLFTHTYKKHNSLMQAIIHFRKVFLSPNHPIRVEKHISNIEKGSAAKRINLFLRWMVRKDKKGVDFGLWNEISMSSLYLPLDIHTGNVARKLKILTRRINDWKAVEEVTNNLKELNPKDPVKYDYALFGLGIFEKF